MTPSVTDEALQLLLEEGRKKASGISPDHVHLWSALADAAAGGKRLRPAFVMATHDALGGRLAPAAASVGAAMELLHTALVIHDDVIDQDYVRRGRPNVSGAFRDRALAAGASADAAVSYARTAAILAGDLALAAAVRAVSTCEAPVAMVHRILDLLDTALHVTAAGELADVRLSVDPAPATLPESLAMAEQKTSEYSFVLPMQAGAVLAGADETTVSRLGAAGRGLGVAFQLVDDLIGVFGDPGVSGKSSTSDLRAGKQTPVLVHARSTSSWPQVEAYVGRDLTPDELIEAQRLLTACGSRRYVEELAQRHLVASRRVIEDLGIPAELVDSMTAEWSILLGAPAVAA